MKKIISVLLLCCGCASICNDMNKCSVSIKSNTPVKVVVKEGGDILCTKTTPCYVGLKGGKGFSRSEYEFEFSRDGYNTATYSRKGSVSGWALGNVVLVFFAPIGVFVDAASGNLFKIGDEDLEVSLSKRYANVGRGSITVYEVGKDPYYDLKEEAMASLYSQKPKHKTTDGTTLYVGSDGNNVTATTINGVTYYQDSNGNSGTAVDLGGVTHYSDSNGNSGTAVTVNGVTHYSDSNGNSGTAVDLGGMIHYSDSKGNNRTVTPLPLD